MSRWKEFRREPVAGEWTRKQKRGYHRVRSLLWFWECHQFQVPSSSLDPHPSRRRVVLAAPLQLSLSRRRPAI